MSVSLDWREIALRLFWTVFAGTLIGINRGEHGRPAGWRTTLLVCLAASVSMIQANLLLGVVGKRPDSFIVLDLMRLPLGILTGMGFIGAGAILRRGEHVTGVTTAATLWFVTVMGLCFGGGQIGLGLASLAIALAVLTVMKKWETHCQRECRARLAAILETSGSNDAELKERFARHGYRLLAYEVAFRENGRRREVTCEVRWNGRRSDREPPVFLHEIAQLPGVLALDWKP